MLKLLRLEITGIESETESASFGHNANYRATMGYDQQTETINVTVDKIVKPDLTREDDVEVNYVTVDERNFKSTDFVKLTDNMAWVVDFDVTTEKITSPLDIWKYTSEFKSSDYTHTKALRTIKQRYSENFTPLFLLYDFYKNSEGFSTATLVFQTMENGERSATVITNDNVEAVNSKAALTSIISNQTHVFYEILDESGNVVNANITPVLEGLNPGFEKVRGDYFTTELPNQTNYKIRVNYTRGLSDKDLPNRFDVRCINAVSSKDRLITGLNGKSTPDYSHLGNGYQDHLDTKFAGYDIINLTCSLEAGDYIKFKLDCGSQETYSELQINLV